MTWYSCHWSYTFCDNDAKIEFFSTCVDRMINCVLQLFYASWVKSIMLSSDSGSTISTLFEKMTSRTIGDSSLSLTTGSSADNDFFLTCAVGSVSLTCSLSLLTGSWSDSDDTSFDEPSLGTFRIVRSVSSCLIAPEDGEGKSSGRYSDGTWLQQSDKVYL